MIGPNCMGIINTDPAVRLNATFSPVAPIEGRVAFSTQSGALGLAILDYVRAAEPRDLDLRVGRQQGRRVGQRPHPVLGRRSATPTSSCSYLESFGNPRRFGQIARRVAGTKPIVAVKAGRSRAGARAASSHTGALAASDVVVDALFRQAGVIRTATLEELFDVAALLAHQPLPAGPRVAVLTNAGGPAHPGRRRLRSQRTGARRRSSDATIVGLRRLLPAAASVGNPVDMLASATPEQYRRATRLLLADDSVDSLLVIFIPPLVTKADEVARAILGGAAGAHEAGPGQFHQRSGRAGRTRPDSVVSLSRSRPSPRSRA